MVERRYAIVVLFVQAVVLATFALTSIGLPFGTGEGVTYWAIVMSIGLPAISMLAFAISVMTMSRAVRTISIILWLLTALWQLFVSVIWFVIVFVGCDDDTQCAGDLACDGTVLGPYTGPRLRFLSLFIQGFVVLVVYVVSVFMAFALRLSRSSFWNMESVDIPAILVLALQMIVVTAYAITSIALPYGSDAYGVTTLVSIEISYGLTMISVGMFILSMIFALPALDIATIVAWSVTAAWHIFAALVWNMILIASCSDRVPCAGNLSCLGVALGPYDGARPRFLAIFVESFVLLIVDAASIIMMIVVRRARISRTTQTMKTK